MPMTITQFRKDIYRVIDESIKQHKPIAIERNGQIIEFTPRTQKKRNKLDNLEPHPGSIIGDPDDLVHVDWSSYWTEEKNL